MALPEALTSTEPVAVRLPLAAIALVAPFESGISSSVTSPLTPVAASCVPVSVDSSAPSIAVGEAATSLTLEPLIAAPSVTAIAETASDVPTGMVNDSGSPAPAEKRTVCASASVTAPELACVVLPGLIDLPTWMSSASSKVVPLLESAPVPTRSILPPLPVTSRRLALPLAKSSASCSLLKSSVERTSEPPVYVPPGPKVMPEGLTSHTAILLVPPLLLSIAP